ncbi:MAG TPA: anthranilate phosphoribosyltransferase [Actinomycetota bacterium]|jgi:anthranilate phosphoribosyltransferase|nr:anthranilate phosphoribosyltransferase [Actinomycetota bacterium]
MTDGSAEPDPDFWPRTLTRLVRHEALDADEAAEAMRRVMAGEATAGQVGGLLMALRSKGETADEVEGFARTMLEFANPVQTPAPVVDIVGTGGDRSGTFNISTASAIVVAGAGVSVAKHGNRAASSNCGSADVLEALGVTIDLDAAGVEACLAEAGVAFLFAPMFHPAMAHAGPVRRELRVPTVFNFLGPLTNPARPFAQAVGCSDARMLPLMAEVLARRGTRGVLFRGEDGLDELTTTGPSIVFEVADGVVNETMLDPAELGFAPAMVEALQGGDAEASAAIVRALLAGETGPKRDVVLLNAGAALEVAGRAADLGEGIALAAETIDSGAAAAALDRWVAASGAAGGTE